MFKQKLFKSKTEQFCKHAAIGALISTFVLSSPLVRADESNYTIASWPEEAQKAANSIIELHGAPNEVTATMLKWHDSSP